MMRKSVLVFALALAAAAVAPRVRAASSPLPDNRKSVIYFGWDTLGATTDDVYRNRGKFAATGFDGICLPLTGYTEKGAEFKGRLPMTNLRFTRAQFADSIEKIREMAKLPGLSGSYLMVYWMSSPRMNWADDAAWETVAANMKFLASVAKETGLKGLFVDHEDYTGKPLFTWRASDDPPYDETLALARRRGREIIRATAEGFPEGRIINDRLLMQNMDCARSQQPREALRMRKDLWTAFVSGVIEAKPASFGFDDGCEHTYGAMTERDYLAAKCEALLSGLPFLDENLRAKYQTSTRVCFGKWMDRWFRKRDLPFVLGKFTESFWGAGVGCDDVYWAYGEQRAIVEWDRKVHPRVDCKTTWNDMVPGLHAILRTSVGDYAPLREQAAKGELRNLVSNSACDSADGRFPAPYATYVEKANRRDGMFAWDGAVGCAAPGALRLAGRGSVILEARGLKPYDRIYVTLAAKGAAPSVNVVWRTKGAYEWYLDYQFLVRPARVDENGWKHYEVAMVVPEKARAGADEVDAVGLIMGGSSDADAPVWFDDISIFKW